MAAAASHGPAATTAVGFFKPDSAYGEFSNFYQLEVPLVLGGKTFATSEHYYHCLKYAYKGASAASLEYAEEIRIESTPYKAKLLAAQTQRSQYAWQNRIVATANRFRERGVAPRSDWDQVKIEVMRRVLRLKFTQNLHCRSVLLGTGERPLQEISPFDAFWGTGKDGTGRNELGKLLMALRHELRESQVAAEGRKREREDDASEATPTQ